jgi:hypothetical protein
MARQLDCPACGEDDDLHGERTDDGISITCGRCGHAWLRDTTPTCATCGGTDLVHRPRPLTSFSRGTQLSILGWQNVPLCVACDHEALQRSIAAGAPLAADYQPAALAASTREA